jgi:splicing factor 3B subunit 3
MANTSGGELYYFHVGVGDQLTEVAKKEMGNEVLCMDIAPIPTGRVHARYLAVGDAETIRILSLDAADCLQSLALLSLQASPFSLSLTEMKGEGDGRTTIYLNAGLRDGVLLRSVVDGITGELSDTRRRYAC